MKSVFAIVASVLLFGTAGFAQPTVSQISNAASASLSLPDDVEVKTKNVTGLTLSIPPGYVGGDLTKKPTVTIDGGESL